MTADYAITRDQARELDRITMEEYGVRGLILMENAGRACARCAWDMLDGCRGSTVAVFCGKGNNGGDGFVVARHLANWGADVSTVLVDTAENVLEKGGDAAVNLQIAMNMDIPLVEAPEAENVRETADEIDEPDLAVDALLGTGITGDVRKPFATAVDALNGFDAPVMSVDVPTGLDCDTGEPQGEAVRAERTVTFVLNKRGYTREGAAEWTGDVRVAEISVPRALIERKLREWKSADSP
jgi:NAD(P)H-hydrate epimerase